MKLTHKMLELPELCLNVRNMLKAKIKEPFDAADAVALVSAPDALRGYQAMVIAGTIPDVGLVWRVAQIAFRETPEHLGLRHWAKDLSKDNWAAAYAAGCAACAAGYASDAADAADAAGYAAGYASDAAGCAAYAADVAGCAADAAGYAADVAAYADAAESRVNAEIKSMIVAAIDAA